MGVTSIGHRKQILKGINEIKSGASCPRTRKIAIEGNIAAGKSTFLNILARELDFYVVPEPVSRWTNMTGEDDDPNATPSSQQTGGNLLDMFYVCAMWCDVMRCHATR
jgi:hypothetical protein